MPSLALLLLPTSAGSSCLQSCSRVAPRLKAGYVETRLRKLLPLLQQRPCASEGAAQSVAGSSYTRSGDELPCHGEERWRGISSTFEGFIL